MKNHVSDEGDHRRYWTQIPNIIFELGLSHYELSLYSHLKRTAGDKGKCFKSTRTLAKECGMSPTIIIRSKQALESPFSLLGNKPLIKVYEKANPNGGKPYHEIVISDIWQVNMLYFSQQEQVPDIDLASSTEAAASSIKHDQQVPYMEHKNNHSKNNQEGGAVPAAVQAIRKLVGKFPKKLLWDDLVRVLGPAPAEAKLERCFKAWTLRDYNPMNLSWATEWYVKGIPIHSGQLPTQAEMNRGGTGNLVL